MENMNKTIVGIGEVLWDLYEDKKFPGGAVANVIHHLKCLGVPALLVSAIGDDGPGSELREALVKNKMDLTYVQTDKVHSTGTVRVKLDENKVPQFTCTKNAAFDFIQWTGELEELAEKTDIVLFGTFAQRNAVSHETIMKFAGKAENATVICDINLRGKRDDKDILILRSLEIANILKANEIELFDIKKVLNKTEMENSGFARFLIEKFGLEIVLISVGPKGCIGVTAEQEHYVPSYKVNVEDTTGAGDAFIGAFTVKHLEKSPLKEAITFANGVAGYVCTKLGAAPFYTGENIKSFLANCSFN